MADKDLFNRHSVKLSELTRVELLKILAKWRDRIQMESIVPDEVNLHAYTILIIDELFTRVNHLISIVDALTKSLQSKEEIK